MIKIHRKVSLIVSESESEAILGKCFLSVCVPNESFGRYVDFRKQLPLKCILAQDKRKQFQQQLFYFPNGAKFACFHAISGKMARKTERKRNIVASSRILSAEATKK